MLPQLHQGCADALLFDLGRVVLDIDFDRVLKVWAGDAGCAAAELAPRFVLDEEYHRHERGEIDDRAFFDSLRRRLGVPLSDAQLLHGWNAIFVGEMPGIEALLARAARQLPLYALSNTNPAHVAHFTKAYGSVLRHFRQLFLSSEIGHRKPAAAAYHHVLAATGVDASRLVFFDDLAENVQAAQTHGLIAFQVKSSEDVARALDQLGL
jgi:putative hydrolase of the HAD superfamily